MLMAQDAQEACQQLLVICLNGTCGATAHEPLNPNAACLQPHIQHLL